MSNDHDFSEPRHPIRVVALRTGLSPDLLRVWERRYAVVEPGRSDGGQRLYSDADIERLDLLHRASLGGRSISRVAGASNDELRDLIEADDRARQAVAPSLNAGQNGRAAAGFVDRAEEAIEKLDTARLHLTLRQAAMTLGATGLIEEVVTPLLRYIGESWHAGTLTPAHEHAASAVIHQVLTWTREAYRPSRSARRFVVATMSGDRHEFGAMLAAGTAAAEGWQVTYLGADLPPLDIARAAKSLEADVLALSSVFPIESRRLLEDAAALKKELGGRATIVVGGSGAAPVARDFERLGITPFGSLSELRQFLRDYNEGKRE